MKVLTVLDSFGKTAGDKAKVYCYDVEGLVNEYEDFIESCGHNLNHCQWLVTDSVPAMMVPDVYYCTEEEANRLNDEFEW
jgi:hypothetical protein